jgi:hypothetical protein
MTLALSLTKIDSKICGVYVMKSCAVIFISSEIRNFAFYTLHFDLKMELPSAHQILSTNDLP